MKRFAPFYKDQIWLAYPPQAGKEDVNKSQEDLLFKFELWDLRCPNYHKSSLKKFEMVLQFQYRPNSSAYPPQGSKENIKKSQEDLFKFEVWDLRGTNYQQIFH